MPLIENTPSFFSPHGCCAYAFEPIPDMSDEEIERDERATDFAILTHALEGILYAAKEIEEARKAVDRLSRRPEKFPGEGWPYSEARRILIELRTLANKAEDNLSDLRGE